MDSSTTITSLDLASSSRHLPLEEGFLHENGDQRDPRDPEYLRFRRPAPLGEAATSGVAGAASSMDVALGMSDGMTPRHAIPASASVPSFAYLSGGATPRRHADSTTPRRHVDATTPRRQNGTLSGSRVNGNITPASPPSEGGGGVGQGGTGNNGGNASRYDLTAAAALARQQQWSLEMLDSLQR